MELELNSHYSVESHIDIFPGSEAEEEKFIAADSIARRSERRVIKPPSRYTEFTFAHTLSVVKETCDVGESSSFSEAVSSQKFVVESLHTTEAEYMAATKGIKEADMMTKPLPLTKFKECVNLVGLCNT